MKFGGEKRHPIRGNLRRNLTKYLEISPTVSKNRHFNIYHTRSKMTGSGVENPKLSPVILRIYFFSQVSGYVTVITTVKRHPIPTSSLYSRYSSVYPTS